MCLQQLSSQTPDCWLLKGTVLIIVLFLQYVSQRGLWEPGGAGQVQCTSCWSGTRTQRFPVGRGRGWSWGSVCGVQDQRRHLGTQVKEEKGGRQSWRQGLAGGVMKSKQVNPDGARGVSQSLAEVCALCLGFRQPSRSGKSCLRCCSFGTAQHGTARTDDCSQGPGRGPCWVWWLETQVEWSMYWLQTQAGAVSGCVNRGRASRSKGREPLYRDLSRCCIQFWQHIFNIAF